MPPKSDTEPGRRRDYKIGLYPREEIIIKRAMQDGKADDLPSAVRFIIREWGQANGYGNGGRS